MFKIDGPGATAQNTFTKGDPVNAIPATEVTDEWLNAVQAEIINAIEQSGLTLDKLDSTQLFQALGVFAAKGDFYSESGAADAYVLTPAFTGFTPAVYTTGMQVRFIPGNANTGASTINVNGLGIKTITTQSGAALLAGDLSAGQGYTLYYDGTNFVLKVIAAPTNLPVGAIIATLSTSTPTGFLKANGAAISRTTYGALFGVVAITQQGSMTSGSSIITGLADTTRLQASMPVSGVNLPVGGTIVSVDSASQITVSVNATASVTQDVTVAPFGVGDSVNTFTLPDLRGEFLRGFDDGRGVDAARVLGSAQLDDFKSHSHASTVTYDNVTGAWPNTAATNLRQLLGSTAATGGTETRPRNVAAPYYIKY